MPSLFNSSTISPSDVTLSWVNTDEHVRVIKGYKTIPVKSEDIFSEHNTGNNGRWKELRAGYNIPPTTGDKRKGAKRAIPNCKARSSLNDKIYRAWGALFIIIIIIIIIFYFLFFYTEVEPELS